MAETATIKNKTHKGLEAITSPNPSLIFDALPDDANLDLERSRAVILEGFEVRKRERKISNDTSDRKGSLDSDGS